MVLVNLTQISFAPLQISEGWVIIRPLMFFVIGMVAYALFVFKFYRFVARKDIFGLNLNQYNQAKHPFFEKLIHGFFYIIEYLLLFPLFTSFWFVILTVLISFLSKDQTIQTIILVSTALVGSVRVTAYFSEDLSRDLAKMLPFALLDIFLIDIKAFNFLQSLQLVIELPGVWRLIIYYLIFITGLEFVLRISYTTIGIFVPHRKDDQKD